MSVVIETTIGNLTIDLFLNERPKTCWNFIKLCKMKYYNYNLFFSIEHNFIAQTGDPSGTGKGGSSIFPMINSDGMYYKGEKIPILKHQNMGMISMASCGDGRFGSQFFFTLGNNLDSLDEEHLVFGQTVEGFDVLDSLNQTLIDETKRPYQDILITHTVILCDPYPDPKEMVFPCDSPPPPLTLFNSNYIAADEDLGNNQLKSLVEIQEEIEAKEAEARATILEMVGDLPSADTAPPENVLFVCKLNPVTTSEDLEVIFSRFGRIQSAEVIRDHITNNSLQYAFIAFHNRRSCEDAYFKMDNVLIDDRRIHVDFSQSVSKIRWKGKGRGVEYFDEYGKRTTAQKSPWTKQEFPHKSLPKHHTQSRQISKPSESFHDVKRGHRYKNHSSPTHAKSEKCEEDMKLRTKKERRDIIKRLKKELKKKKKGKKSKSKKKHNKSSKKKSKPSSDSSSSSDSDSSSSE